MEEEISILFEEAANRSAAYADGEPVGECEFSVDGNTWTITHTGVRPAFGGRGIAGKLVEQVVDAARSKQVRIVPQCSYAAKMMAGKDEYRDVL